MVTIYGCNIRSKSDEDDKDNVVVFVLLIKVQRKLDRVRGANEEELVREVLPPWSDSINIQLLGEKDIFSRLTRYGKKNHTDLFAGGW